MKLEKALRQEAEKLEAMKKERMVEVLRLKKKDENICHKMEMDPFHLSTTVVPSTTQLNGLKEHIRTMEEEKFDREERFVTMKETILKRYMELEEEPETEFERYLPSCHSSVLVHFLSQGNCLRGHRGLHPQHHQPPEGEGGSEHVGQHVGPKPEDHAQCG